MVQAQAYTLRSFRGDYLALAENGIKSMRYRALSRKQIGSKSHSKTARSCAPIPKMIRSTGIVPQIDRSIHKQLSALPQLA